MARKTKAQLERELVTARDRIQALERELENRESGQEDDVIPDRDWAWLRSALDGHVGEDADHMDLISEAVDHLRDYFRQPAGTEEIAGLVRDYNQDLKDTGDILDRVRDAFELREEWIAHGLDDLESTLWRKGVLRGGISMFEALETLTW